jgi:hypothetical protein
LNRTYTGHVTHFPHFRAPKQEAHSTFALRALLDANGLRLDLRRHERVAQTESPRLPLRSAVARGLCRVGRQVRHRRGNHPADVSGLLSAVGRCIEIRERSDVVRLVASPFALGRALGTSTRLRVARMKGLSRSAIQCVANRSL